MSTPEVRRPMKGYVRNNRRRKLALDVDLNVPPTETLEETAAHAGTSQPAQTVTQGHGGSSSGGSGLQAPPTIDVEAIDDEVVISSPRRFAEARKKNRRNNNGTVVFHQVSRALPGNSVIEEDTRLYLNNYNMRSRVPPNQTVIDCEEYVNVESFNNAKCQREDVNTVQFISPPPPPPPPPPKEPTFSCPVCMGPLVEEASTKCGHIFCKKCIKAAISAQSKCPTCRRKLTMKDVIRVYLPTTS